MRTGTAFLGVPLLLAALGCTARPPEPRAAPPEPRAAPRPPCALDDLAECERACRASDAESCARWGALRGAGGEASNDLLELLLKACGAGSGRGCNGAGVLLEQGVAGVTSLERSLAMYHRAAELGYATAYYNLGQRYRDAVGVARDAARACHFYDAGCGHGDPDACFALGTMYWNRDCAEASEREVHDLVEKGCNLPSRERLRHRDGACGILGEWDQRGSPPMPRPARAAGGAR